MHFLCDGNTTRISRAKVFCRELKCFAQRIKRDLFLKYEWNKNSLKYVRVEGKMYIFVGLFRILKGGNSHNAPRATLLTFYVFLVCSFKKSFRFTHLVYFTFDLKIFRFFFFT